CGKHDTVFAVLGNHDAPEFLEELEDRDVNIERTLNFWNGLAFIGSGGSTAFTNDTPNELTEDDILSDYAILDASADAAPDGTWPQLVVVSHNPPKDTRCDAVNERLHAGSAQFRRLIEEKKPLAVVAGHIHEGAGIDRIGGTTVVNPGALAAGSYAVLELEERGGVWQVSAAELRRV
ncbi:MAG: metallophosphoesterase family protein, partial [Treponemataceae bacterium]|nr:metallophosphoesterase family protein [Treponemataceae bacterium]